MDEPLLSSQPEITTLSFVPLSSFRWVRLGRLSLRLGMSLLGSALGRTDLYADALSGTCAESFEVWHDPGPWWLHDSVTAVVQTHDGYLWLGTYHGLVRFDGVRFTVFDSGNAPELANGRITSLYESPDRVLWIGHETGHLSRMADGHFQSVKLSTNWPGGVIDAIASDQEGNVWLLNHSGFLFRLCDGMTATTPGGASALRKATLARARDGTLWMASNGQLAILERGRVVPVVFPGDQSNESYERIFAAEGGGVWVLGNGQLRKWCQGAWRETIEALPGMPGAIDVMVETRYGLLVGTMRSGLYLLRFGAKPLHFTRADGLSHDWVRALTMDREGNCWIGTGTGFDGLRLRKVRMVAPGDNWQGCTVRSFIVQPDGAAWVGTEGAGLYQFDGQRWTMFNETNGLLSRFVWSVLETKQHDLFVGTWGGGLYRRCGDGFESSGELAKITAPVTALYEDGGGKLWIGTQEGLYSYQEGELSRLAGKDKLAVPDVRAITQSADGTLWFGMSGGGLGALKNGALKQFGKAHGLSSDLVSCLCADPDGTLWIGTSDNGLTRLKKDTFCTISLERGLPSKAITHIVDDQAGCLWLGSQRGILRVSKAELNRCADGQTDSIRCVTYGRDEGLTTPTCTSGFQPGACRSPDGQLWFPTIEGLAVLRPGNVTTNLVPPPVAIESLLVDGMLLGNRRPAADGGVGGQYDPATPSPVIAVQHKPLRIRPGHHRFEFSYTGLSFVAPDKVRFRRKLEGLENEWVDVGTKRSVEYNYLTPGQYTFRVIACNNDDVWNQEGASLSFTVLPFFWQTLGFRAASMASSAGVLAVGVLWAGRRRLRRELELAERQGALERERGRIARDMHDELGASLTRISLLSESVRGELSSQPQVLAEADQIHSTAREVIRAMDEIVWAVNPAYDTLESLVAYLGRYAERYLDTVGIRCRLNVPLQVPRRALSAEVRHNVFLAFKEALHNVVKHAHATEVRISVELHTSGFVVLVADNGRGFVLNAAPAALPLKVGQCVSPAPSNVGQRVSPVPPASSAESAEGLQGNLSSPDVRLSPGNGLVNIRKRMEEIGGDCAWDTSPGQGTRLKLVTLIKS
jgi:ligand-binding sensor domain-containing protein/signal transduction histidine kinase